jgi:hypothetical protein
MSVVVKMMSAEDMPDSSPYKGFKLITVPAGGEVTFGLNADDKPSVMIYIPGAAETIVYEMTGNVYVLNENGKTIASQSFRDPIETPVGDGENRGKTPEEIASQVSDWATDVLGRVFQRFDKVKAKIGATTSKELVKVIEEFLQERLKDNDTHAIDIVVGLFNKIPTDKAIIEVGRKLGRMEFGDVTQVLFHAGNFCPREQDRFIAAVGEYLAGLVKKGDAEALAALKHIQEQV